VRAAPESADEYPHVVAMLTDGRRVIECAADIQWVIQVHKGRPLNPWVYGARVRGGSWGGLRCGGCIVHGRVRPVR
jgi:hypothetical protein